MCKSRYTEEQIVAILKESEAGLPTAERIPIPCTIAPWLTVRNGEQALRFYHSAFGATINRGAIPGHGAWRTASDICCHREMPPQMTVLVHSARRRNQLPARRRSGRARRSMRLHIGKAQWKSDPGLIADSPAEIRVPQVSRCSRPWVFQRQG